VSFACYFIAIKRYREKKMRCSLLFFRLPGMVLTTTLLLLSGFPGFTPLQAQTPPALFDSLLRVKTDTVYFASGSWELDSTALNLLGQLSPASRSQPQALLNRAYRRGGE
jgi:hypothetical protein